MNAIPTWIRGEQIGEVAQNGKPVLKQYEFFCMKHPLLNGTARNPVLMRDLPVVELDGKIVFYAVCSKCEQKIKQGEYYPE